MYCACIVLQLFSCNTSVCGNSMFLIHKIINSLQQHFTPSIITHQSSSVDLISRFTDTILQLSVWLLYALLITNSQRLKASWYKYTFKCPTDLVIDSISCSEHCLKNGVVILGSISNNDNSVVTSFVCCSSCIISSSQSKSRNMWLSGERQYCYSLCILVTNNELNQFESLFSMK